MLSPGSLKLFIEEMFMYSGCCWSKLLGEMQDTDRDRDLTVCSDLELGDFLRFSLLEFLDLDC